MTSLEQDKESRTILKWILHLYVITVVARTNKISRPVAFEKHNLSYYTSKNGQKPPDRKYKMTYLVKDLTDISL